MPAFLVTGTSGPRNVLDLIDQSCYKSQLRKRPCTRLIHTTEMSDLSRPLNHYTTQPPRNVHAQSLLATSVFSPGCEVGRGTVFLVLSCAINKYIRNPSRVLKDSISKGKTFLSNDRLNILFLVWRDLTTPTQVDAIG